MRIKPPVCSPLLDSVQYQCTISQSVSAIVGRGSFGTVLFSLPLIPVCIVYVLFFASVHWGIPLDIIFYFVVESLKYVHIMSRID